MYVSVSAICPPPPTEFQDAGAEENQTHLLNALYPSANEKVDLLRPNEQSVSLKSTDASSLTSLLAKSAARSSSFQDLYEASWRNFGSMQNNVQSTPDNDDTSPDNGERSSFRRSSKPIRRRSTIRKAPIPEVNGSMSAQSASSEDTEEIDLYSAAPLDEACEAGDCKQKVFKPVAAPRKNKTNHLRTDNPDTLDDYNNQNGRRVSLEQLGNHTGESTDNDSAFMGPMLTGDEHCVEDWPEGSPELDPNFRPTGSLRLRRESLRLKDLEEVISELTKKPSKHRTLKRFKSKTKTTSRQNQDPQRSQPIQVQTGAPSPDSPMPAMNLPSQGAQDSSEDMERGSDLLTRGPLRSSSSSLTSVTSNPWVNFGASPGDSAPVNPLADSDTNYPRPSPYRPACLDQAAAVNPLPTIYEANNIPQAGAQVGNNMSAATRNQEDDVAVDDATAAAMADWFAAEMDEINRAREAEEEEGEDGDADSLMDWWYTVEEWNEPPVHVNNMLNQEAERRTFSILIDKVRRGLIVFDRVFTECADILWQSVIILHAFADNIKKLHRVEKISNITVTVAVVLSYFTMGVSALALAPAFGVAAVRQASVRKDIKKAAAVLVDNTNYLLEMQKIVVFIRTGLFRLRDHPVLLSRRGFTGDEQEIQKAIEMQRLLTAPVSQALAANRRAVNAVKGMFSGMNRFVNLNQDIRKKKHVTSIVNEINGSADVLHSCLFELSNIKNQLQVASERCGLTQ